MWIKKLTKSSKCLSVVFLLPHTIFYLCVPVLILDSLNINTSVVLCLCHILQPSSLACSTPSFTLWCIYTTAWLPLALTCRSTCGGRDTLRHCSWWVLLCVKQTLNVCLWRTLVWTFSFLPLQVQFLMFLVYTGRNLLTECDFPKSMNLLVFCYCITLVILFGNFYYQSYVNKKKQK